MKTMARLLAIAVLIVMLVVSAASAQDKLSLEEMANIDEVLVPSPSELFAAIDTMGDFEWDMVVNVNTNAEYSSGDLRALNLGSRAGVGFLAIQAKDNQKLGQTITTLLKLARALAVDEMILAKGSELHALATNKKWGQVRQELDNLKVQVEDYIKQLGDDELAVLVSAGGWLEGLRAVTKLLSEQYNEQASTVLHQPALIRYFKNRFGKLSDKYKSTRVVKDIEAKLPEIEQLLQGEPGKPIPKENVEKLNKISTDLILAIERG